MYRFQGLDSLMTSRGITDSKTFEAYLKAVFSKRENQDENFAGFEWDAPQINFTYEMLQAEKQIEVMASYVDLNSPALPSGHTTKIETLKGSIPRMKYAVVRGENDYRKQLITLNEVKSVAAFRNTNESTAVSAFLAKQLFFSIDEIYASFKNSLNYQIGQMKSAAELSLTDDNNPRGSIRATFKAQVPVANHIKKQWFTKTSQGVYTEVGGSDPITDIRDFVRELRWKANGYELVTIEISERYLYKLLSHSEVLKAIGYATTGLGLRYSKANDENAIAVAKGMSLDAQKAALKTLLEADELITNKTVCGVEKLNKATRKYERKAVDAFNTDVILIRPMGTIGVIKNVVPLRPDGQAIVGGVYGGRGIIEYIYNRDTREQRWQGELTALAVPTRPNDMYYFEGVSAAD